jgi:hypothetical protein
MIMQVITTATKPSVNKMKNMSIDPLVRERATHSHSSTTPLKKAHLKTAGSWRVY